MSTLKPLINLLQARYIQKLNLHYTRGIAPKRITSGEIRLRSLASGQHSPQETSQRWRLVGDTVSNLAGSRIEPQTSRVYSGVSNHYAKWFATSKRAGENLITTFLISENQQQLTNNAESILESYFSRFIPNVTCISAAVFGPNIVKG